MPIPNTSLPDDFVTKILVTAQPHKQTLRDAVDDAILKQLHRPLTTEEKWAMIDHLDTDHSAANLAQAIRRQIGRDGST